MVLKKGPPDPTGTVGHPKLESDHSVGTAPVPRLIRSGVKRLGRQMYRSRCSTAQVTRPPIRGGHNKLMPCADCGSSRSRSAWYLPWRSFGSRLPEAADIQLDAFSQSYSMRSWCSASSTSRSYARVPKGTLPISKGHSKGPVATPEKEHIANREQIVYIAISVDYAARFGAAANLGAYGAQ